ncbi:DUF769 domain-containing protein [Xylella taiwanensis]|uniref:DUF769 domain-containing protein n=1 Tax=Xylella taiwanensis TaxID=1444770 RepID=Z9JGU1_9GAMM|nr:DUF769 domain-containing protein [Xylella taiwanensis]AXI83700.1 hypothetical protein AB672_07030 [Xylella taiwanensis]EWS76967.1 hypothetical protein AF72_13335 [Xylella taiwanensis]QKD98623.1 DUF769 domain-containing protein [Xylella taiwanensis]UFM93897.1 DUF769 domain-containing protein [Xylella taiwanensis]UFN02478.1 DUF769 domain-containing protein [Xylella taiwanensis]
MHSRIKLGVLILASSVLLACSGPGPVIDSRTGKPMLAGPWENRDLSLEYFKVDFLGQYTVKHAFINGINIKRCYPGSPPDNVQVVMMSFRNGSSNPGIVSDGYGKRPPRPADKYAYFIGYPYYRSTPQPDGTVKKQVAGVEFNALCDAEFAGRNDINFGIRSTASESIQTHVQRMVARVSAPDRAYKSNRFLEPPRTETRWGNAWTWYRAYMPTPVGDGVETWMTPIGDSGYYITVNFNFIEAARQQNTEDYQRARKLMDGILQSMLIQKQ